MVHPDKTLSLSLVLGGVILTAVVVAPPLYADPTFTWERAAYWDVRYPNAWAAGQAVGGALASAGYRILDADQLQVWMSARITDRVPSVVVFCQDVVPDTVVEWMSSTCTLRQYLNAGGKMVWFGGLPMNDQGHSNGTLTYYGVDGSKKILGFNADRGPWDSEQEVVFTAEGLAWGLTETWRSIRPTDNTSVRVLARDAGGYAAAWVKHYVQGDTYRGFVRLFDRPGVPNCDDVRRAAEYPHTPQPPKPSAAGSVNLHRVHQTLEGFGAAGAWYEGWLTSHPLKSEIYDCLFRQLGLDIYRIRNTYGFEPGYMDRSVEIVKAAEASLGHPIRVMISSWSPPGSLKSGGNVVGGTLKKDASGRYVYGDFADWWADSVAYLSSRGIETEYVNIQNEPDYLASWASCKFTPTETSAWAGYNLAFESVYQELHSRMSKMPKLLAPETCGFGGAQAYIDALVDDSHAYGWAHHLYGDGSYHAPDAYIPGMSSFATQYGDKPLLQTEFAKGESTPLTFTDAMNLAILMHNALTVEEVSAYLYWELFWVSPRGLVSLGNPWQANPGYTVNPTYYAFKQYSAWTDPGWRRVEASTDSAVLRVSAFTSPDANELTFVVINVSDIDIALSLSLGDFLPGESSVYRTGPTQNAAYVGTFDPAQSLRLPKKTITTVHLTGAVSPVTIETFEEGRFGDLPWQFSGDASWFVTADQSNTGSYSARAGAIEDGQTSTLTIELECLSGDISFYRKVSSESPWDVLCFSMDGVEEVRWSGDQDWAEVSFPVTAGRRTLEWIYSKDSSTAIGGDTAWIDDIVFPY